MPNSTETLHFRGIRNFDAAVNFALSQGMSKATDFVLSGGSAGGLSTFLHADRVASRLKAEAPGCKKIRAAPIVGYFLDHDNFKHTTGLPGGPNSPQWAKPGTGATYTTWMKYVYKMQNMTFGADGGLTAHRSVQGQVSDRAWDVLHVTAHARVHRDAFLYVQQQV